MCRCTFGQHVLARYKGSPMPACLTEPWHAARKVALELEEDLWAEGPSAKLFPALHACESVLCRFWRRAQYFRCRVGQRKVVSVFEILYPSSFVAGMFSGLYRSDSNQETTKTGSEARFLNASRTVRVRASFDRNVENLQFSAILYTSGKISKKQTSTFVRNPTLLANRLGRTSYVKNGSFGTQGHPN